MRQVHERRPEFSRAMRKSRLIGWLVMITLAALAAAWFWAVRPALTPLLYIYSGTEADLVRRLWHFRLVQPEWVGNQPDYMKWAIAETKARLCVLFLGWLVSVIAVLRKYWKGRGNTRPPDSFDFGPNAKAGIAGDLK
jgi:hypothetical protein